ncbi:MAG: dihydroxy-acid dehydratase, partial [Robiginitalea sp.]
MNLIKYRIADVAMVFAVAMFFWGCEDTYQRVGEDRPETVYPQGVAEDFVLTYTETLEELQSGKPIIGIAQTGSDLSPCNKIHVFLVDRVKAGIREAGGIPLEFP